MSGTMPENRLRRNDYLILIAFCALLFGSTIGVGRVLSGHESVVPQGVREMLADGDWLVPKCGGIIWLERPPLSHWFIAGLVTVTGSDQDWMMRTSAALAAAFIVCLVAWMAAIFLGRGLAVLTGLILASMQEFTMFAVDPEADIFLCAVITACMASFLYLEFVKPVRDEEPNTFLGGRSWHVLLFFVLLGMTNLVKGLLFGTLMVVVPLGAFFLWSFDWKAIKRYLWLWGWLACAAVWLSWPIAVWLRHPGILDLWKSDYIGRLNGGYVGEPSYYYLITLPWVLFPWFIAAFVGMRCTRTEALTLRGSPARFLWAWGLSVPLFFSIPDGKHHHYLLHSMAPWAMLAAIGTQRIWAWKLDGPAWARRWPVNATVIAVAVDVAIYLCWDKIKGPDSTRLAFLVGVPMFVYGFLWALAQRDARVALVTTLLLLVAGHTFVIQHADRYHNSYHDEMKFFASVEETVPEGQTLFLAGDDSACLETFRVLFYMRERPPRLLQNPTFLLDEKIQQQQVYVMARHHDEPMLNKYGQVDKLFDSKCLRHKGEPTTRRALYRLTYRTDVERKPANVYITAMQATRRASGPYLK